MVASIPQNTTASPKVQLPKVNTPVVNAPTNKTEVLPVQHFYKKLGTTPEGYVSYINVFDNSKGFNYVATARTEKDSTYTGVEHMAHFLYDKDFTTGKSAKNSEAARLDETIDKSKFRANNPGSTVSDPYFTVYKNNSDGKTTNVKYVKADELKSSDKVGDPLRQYRFNDINWASHGSAVGFNKTVEAKYTKDGQQSYFINPTGQPDAYGKFGGNSVVFLVDGTNIAIDFAGSNNQIKTQGEQIIKDYKIDPKNLILAYHDVGSYSAKVSAHNHQINSKDYKSFNTNHQTGAGLAIPTQN